jgi:hypothetical protein
MTKRIVLRPLLNSLGTEGGGTPNREPTGRFNPRRTEA